MSDTKDVAFFNPHDGVKGRDGGPYLDFVERENAEKVRAAKEGREPETDGSVPAVAGTPLVTVGQLVDNSHTSNVSRGNAPGLEVQLTDENFTDADFLADPVTVLPVDTGTEPPAEDVEDDDDSSPSLPEDAQDDDDEDDEVKSESLY